MRRLFVLATLLLFTISSYAVLPPITGTTTVCEGTNATLSNATTGGTWTSGAGTIASIDPVTGIYTGAAAGTAIITYTSGTDEAYATVTVNPSPAMVAAPSDICVGTTGAFTSAPVGGLWSSSNPAVAPISSTGGVATGVAAGVATITYTLGTGCYTTSALTVSPAPPPLTGTATLCVGNSVTLSSAAPGGYFASCCSSIASVAATTGVVTGVSTGTATISYIYGACSTTRVVTVSSAVAPITGSLGVCTGLTSPLADATMGGTWSTSAPTIASVDASGLLSGHIVGTTTVSYVTPAGCYATAIVTVNGTSGTISGATTLCAGTSTPFTASSGVGGSWSSSTTTVATVGTDGSVYGTGIGTATITYAAGTCGIATQSVTVTSFCTGVPATGAVTASAGTVCSGTSVVLNLPSYSYTCGHIIQWQYSADGLAWSDLAGATTVPLVTYPTASYYYRCSIRCASTGATAISGPIHVNVDYEIGSHSVVYTPSSVCLPTHFHVTACGVSSLFSVVTIYGDGSRDTTAMTTTGVSYADVYHSYAMPGVYTIRYILLNGTVPVDTADYSYDHHACSTLPVRFYQDRNTNCIFDAPDAANSAVVYTQVDSNGTPVDTIAATSGYNYIAYGPTGTVYRFYAYRVDGGLVAMCPATAMVYDTISATSPVYNVRNVGLICSGTSAYDLSVTSTVSTGRHSQVITMNVYNYYCLPVSPVLTLTHSPKFEYLTSYAYTYPTPTSVSGSTVNWSLPILSPFSNTVVNIHLERTATLGPWLPVGDTVQTNISVGPTSGDTDPSNNIISRVDTVRSSFDPNEIAVSPSGYILPCTELEYTVHFENTGNDTARNIYVLDTLPANTDAGTLHIINASHPMNYTLFYNGTDYVARFDFPEINLLDTSHRNLCDGFFKFRVKAASTIPDGSVVANRVGIYFDNNPVVMTNEVRNVVGIAPITGPTEICLGTSDTVFNSNMPGVWSSSTPAVGTISTIGIVSGLTTGTTVISYTFTNLCTSRTATEVLTVNPIVPADVAITHASADSVCAGTSVTFTANPTAGGITPSYSWKVNSTIVGGGDTYTYFPLAGDTVSVTMASGSVCSVPGIVSDTVMLTVLPMTTPDVAIVVNPGDTSCSGSPVIFTALPSYGGATPGYEWFVNGALAGTGTPFIFTPLTGDVIYCRMGSNYMCRLADTVNSSDVHMTVDPLYIPVVSISAAPSLSITVGDMVTFTATVSGAGPDPTYEWLINGFIVPGATTNVYSSNSLADYDSVTCRVTGSGVCHISSFNSVFINVWGVGVSPVDVSGTLHLSPNPTVGNIHLAGSLQDGTADIASISITNTLGQRIWQQSVPVSAGTITTDISLPGNIANGVYLLSITGGNAHATLRFVLQR